MSLASQFHLRLSCVLHSAPMQFSSHLIGGPIMLHCFLNTLNFVVSVGAAYGRAQTAVFLTGASTALQAFVINLFPFCC